MTTPSLLDLFAAIEAHDAPLVARLLKAGADPGSVQPDWPKFSAMHAAINELEDGGPIDILRLLLDHGAPVDGWDGSHESTPLLMALFRDNAAAARLLLEAGADPNVRGAEGDSPLRWVVERKDLPMVNLLLDHGAAKTIDEPGEPRGRTALGIATEHLDIDIIQRLLLAGADPLARDYDSATARERLPPRDASDPAQRAAVLEMLAAVEK